jgi:hypothetical protein
MHLAKPEHFVSLLNKYKTQKMRVRWRIHRAFYVLEKNINYDNASEIRASLSSCERQDIVIILYFPSFKRLNLFNGGQRENSGADSCHSCGLVN